MLFGNFAEMTTSTPFRDLLHAAYRRLYFLSEGRHAEDFFALKNPTASAGFEPANLDTKGQHATHRLPSRCGVVAIKISLTIIILLRSESLKKAVF